eukprot:COSAG05_NODE_16058_length_354_cov_1.125490_2_plen_28_part_01
MLSFPLQRDRATIDQYLCTRYSGHYDNH